MNYYKIFHLLPAAIIFTLLVMAIPASPVLAAGSLRVSPDEVEIGDKVTVTGSGYEAGKKVYIFISSQELDEDDDIKDLDVYYRQSTRSGAVGDPDEGKIDYTFRMPGELDRGDDAPEYVHGDDYYVYVTYFDSTIVAVAKFTVIGGEIEINPEEGQVGTEVDISGLKFGIIQKITIEYDGDVIDIAGGDRETDSNGKFTSTILIPDSIVGAHTISVFDEIGNETEAEFSVEPKTTIDPTSGAVGDVITVSGTGFSDRGNITITVDNERVSTTPFFIQTKHNGNFTGSFLLPPHAVSGTSKIKASDGSFNWAEAELTILAGISLSPATSQSSPGYVGTKLTIYGTGFIAGDKVTITYNDIKVETTTADTDGNFRVTFTAPPSIAGIHPITATDGTNTLTATFTMESAAPPIPVPLLPELATTAEAEAYFDWDDVTDPSGTIYTLQIAIDVDFTSIVLEKKGLTDSEYTITKEEKLKSTKTDAPYYWRVKVVDGAANESKWTIPMLFYVGLSPELAPSWSLYIWIGVGVLLLGILGFWVLKRIKG